MGVCAVVDCGRLRGDGGDEYDEEMLPLAKYRLPCLPIVRYAELSFSLFF